MLAAVLHGAEDLKLEPVEDRPLAADEVRAVPSAPAVSAAPTSPITSRAAVGDFALQEPLVLGHELPGRSSRPVPPWPALKPGDRVAIDPSRPCLTCDYCRCGRRQSLPSDAISSAAPRSFPHVQGGFRRARRLRAPTSAIPVPGRHALRGSPLRRAACPSACTRVAAGRRTLGRSVVITGTGPIGCLTALRRACRGRRHVTVTDLVDAPLERGQGDAASTRRQCARRT